MIWLLRVLLAATIFASVLSTTPAPGLKEQLWLGQRAGASIAATTVLGAETFSAPGSFTGAFGWLRDAAEAFVVHYAGTFGLQVLTAVAIVATLALVERRARRNAPELFAFGAAVLAAALLLGSLRAGAGALEWLAAAAFMLLVDAASLRAALAATLLAIVWCNLSASGFFAPYIALAYALGAQFDAPAGSARSRLPWLAFGGCLLAAFLTPGGVHFVALAPAALHLDGSPAAPVAVAPLAYRSGFAVALLVLTFLGLRGSPSGDILSCMGALVVALLDGHQLPLFGIVAAPVLAAAAQRAYPARIPPAWNGLAFALVALLWLGGWSSARASAADIVPGDLVARLRSDGLQHRVFCTRLDWCGEAVAAGDARLRVYMDEREPAYPASVRTGQHLMAVGGPHWRASLERARIDAIVVDRHAVVAGLLELNSHWMRAAEQGPLRLYLRTAPG